MIAVAKSRRAKRERPGHALAASGRERDLSRRVTARLVCRCGHIERGEPVEASPLMAAHVAAAAGA